MLEPFFLEICFSATKWMCILCFLAARCFIEPPGPEEKGAGAASKGSGIEQDGGGMFYMHA